MGEPISIALSAAMETLKKTIEMPVTETRIQESAEVSINAIGPAQQLEVMKGSSLEGLRAQNVEMLNALKETTDAREPAKLCEMKPDEVRECLEAYHEEVRKFSADNEAHTPDTGEWEKVSATEYIELRKDWVVNKNEYIKGWEKENGKPWPTYSEDYMQNDKVIRKEGDLYDAHHMKPVEFGGKNSAENITPMHAKDHMDHKGIHRPDGPYGELARHFRNA